MEILIGHYKWWGLSCTHPRWEWPTCGGCQPTPMVNDMITPKGVWYFLIWSWNFLALWGMLDTWHYVLEASQSCDRLTIGLTNMYHEWAIKLLGIYKKSMMIRKVCWMCYKSDEKFMIKYFIVYLKIRLLNYFKFLIMSFYYYMKGKLCIFIWKFISYFKNNMKTIYQKGCIHKIFDLHAFLLNTHGT